MAPRKANSGRRHEADAATTNVIPSDPPKPEIIELSSDSESDYEVYLNMEEKFNEAAETSDSRPSPSTAKRRAVDETMRPGSESPNSKRQKLPMRVRDTESLSGHRRIEIEIPIATRRPAKKAIPEAQISTDKISVAATPSTNKSGHIRFGDTSPDQFYTPLEQPTKNPLETVLTRPTTTMETEIPDSDDDDDAPPEAVSTTAVAAETLKSAQVAAKAAEQQAAAQKRKRQERDALFKTQAETRKRAAVAEEDEEEATPSEAAGDGKDAASAVAEAESTVSSKKRKLGKAKAPALLPAEFLESDDSGDEDVASSAALKKPKRINFNTMERNLAKQSRPPRDRRVGKTVYRVLTDRGDGRLAPKMAKHSRNLKQELLARKRVGQRYGGGFLVKR